MRRYIRTAAVAVAAFVLAGCSASTTDVTGTVKYQDKLVVYGNILLIGADGIPRSGPIQPDGTFRVPGMPLGPARVAVSSPPPPGASLPGRRPSKGGPIDPEKGGDPPAAIDQDLVRRWFALPEKYGEPTQSELTVDVRPGRPLDLDLK